MAWRIDSSIIQGEFDFTIRGEVEGTLVAAGRAEPVLVLLTGVPWRDLAGHRLRFSRRVGLGEVVALAPGFAGDQSGSAGDMTASRKVKVPDRPIEELFHRSSDPKDFPLRWENCLYLEWFSEKVRSGPSRGGVRTRLQRRRLHPPARGPVQGSRHPPQQGSPHSRVDR